MRRFLFLFALLFWGAAAAAAPQSSLVIQEIPSPSGPRSQTPFLSSNGREAFLSWEQQVKEGQTDLYLSRWDGAKWSQPSAVVSGAPLFQNWADFPSVIPLPDGKLAAHWLQKAGAGSYAYDVMFAVSKDSGKSWSAPLKPHHDQVKGEHGFVSLVPQAGGRVLAVWLDSRKFKDGADDRTNEMQLMSGVFNGSAFEQEAVLDPRTCDCCQTTAVAVPGGVFVAYRDRSPEEIRDISYVRLSGKSWSAPRPLNKDGWKIAGCPVNGPAAASMDNRVVVAWFTAAGEKPRVQVVFSSDGGNTFGAPVRVDGGNPTGRVDVEWLGDGSALVVWLESSGDKAAELKARRVRADGTPDPAVDVAPATSARAGGFPRMTRWQKGVLLAWTDTGKEASTVRIVGIQPR